MANPNIDPITLQVIGGALDTIAKEMGHVLYRMSYSSIIRESQDLGAGLFDAAFNTLCESDSTPMHIGSIPGYLRGIDASLQSQWEPGDVVIFSSKKIPGNELAIARIETTRRIASLL